MDNTITGLIEAAQIAAQAKNNVVTAFLIVTLACIAFFALCAFVRHKAEMGRRDFELRRRRDEQAEAEQADVDFYASFGRATR